MDEHASFEACAVLAPRRVRLSRLALLLPVVALVAIAWAGASGARPDRATAEASAALADPTPGAAPTVEPPTQVFGLDVQGLADVRPLGLGRAEVIAVAGWYATTAITDCPELAALYRPGSLPWVRGDADEWAFCNRTGVLYASRPDPYASAHENRWTATVAVSIVVGVIVPLELEMIGAAPTEVVVVGRFVESGNGCRASAACNRELVVDHVAWAALGAASSPPLTALPYR